MHIHLKKTLKYLNNDYVYNMMYRYIFVNVVNSSTHVPRPSKKVCFAYSKHC